MIDIHQSPVLCRHTNKTNQHLNILANLRANSFLCRPTWISSVPRLRLINKIQGQPWPQFSICSN